MRIAGDAMSARRPETLASGIGRGGIGVLRSREVALAPDQAARADAIYPAVFATKGCTEPGRGLYHASGRGQPLILAQCSLVLSFECPDVPRHRELSRYRARFVGFRRIRGPESGFTAANYVPDARSLRERWSGSRPLSRERLTGGFCASLPRASGTGSVILHIRTATATSAVNGSRYFETKYRTRLLGASLPQ